MLARRSRRRWAASIPSHPGLSAPPRALAGRPRGRRAALEPSVALTCLHLFSLPRWFAETLWSLFSVSAHSKLLAVNTGGGVPATEEATRETALGAAGFSWCDMFPAPSSGPLQSVGLCRWGGMRRKKGGRGKRRRPGLLRSFLMETNSFLLGPFFGSWNRRGILTAGMRGLPVSAMRSSQARRSPRADRGWGPVRRQGR